MNCKPGDLALVIKSAIGNEGRIVRVIDWREALEWVHIVGGEPGLNARAGWRVEGRLRYVDSNGGSGEVTEGVMPDECLRPLRGPGEDATDEMVQLLGSPRLEEVPCQ